MASAGMSDAQIMEAINGSPGQRRKRRFYPTPTPTARAARIWPQARAPRDAAARRGGLGCTFPDLPLKTADEAPILASIVEKETGAAAERGRIAAVFTNRLRVGMPLQTDPTVIYGLGEAFDGNLRKRDLLADTPFNTYTRPGCRPRRSRCRAPPPLRAAVRPDASKALYFVSRGNGTSEFSSNARRA